MMDNTYFDRREGKVKPLPDCSCVGLVWDEQTQRCERKGLWERVMADIEQSQGFEDDPLSGWEFDAEGWELENLREAGSGNGLGFLLPAAAAAPSIWPAIASVGSAIGGFFANLFGGGDDQATNYRPPVNAAAQFVQFNDSHGQETVAYDMSQASLAEAARRGNRAEDVYSYYSAFLTNSTNAGASPAARRVIEDAARKHGISISRAADWILNTAGVARIVQSFLPGPQGGNTSAAHLPPYCPVGSYHPFPIGHAQQDLCVPFPVDALPQSQQQQQQRQSQSRSARRRQGQRSQQPGVPAGYRVNPLTGQLEPDPDWLADGSETGGDKFPWWIWLLIAGGVVYATSGDGDRESDYYRRRPRR